MCDSVQTEQGCSVWFFTFRARQAASAPLDEATAMPACEIVENPVLPVVQGVEEFIETGDACRFDPLDPEVKASLGGGPIRGLVKDGGQQGAQHVSAGQSRRLFEQFDHLPLLVGIQGPPFAADQGPQKLGWV